MNINLENYKPNLIPNNGKDGKFGRVERNQVIWRNGGIKNYAIGRKKDGIRLHAGLAPTILSRAMKIPNSILVIERFRELNELCLKLNIAIDGEFYEHGLKFNQIQRFYSNTDVTSEKYRKKLEKELLKNPEKFKKDYEGDSIEFLTEFRKTLRFWIFDGIVLDRPDLEGYEERMNEILHRLDIRNMSIKHFTFLGSLEVNDIDLLEEEFNNALEAGFEGLVLTHKDHKYKYGRNSLKQGTILKMKNDSEEYDGVIVEVLEGTIAKEGAERQEANFGKTTTSRKKKDRVGSNKAKGFLIQYEGKGEFIVGLQGFDDEDKKELLNNKESYIGRHFKYKAMEPVKDFPRHAYFKCWRDEK